MSFRVVWFGLVCFRLVWLGFVSFHFANYSKPIFPSTYCISMGLIHALFDTYKQLLDVKTDIHKLLQIHNTLT